MLSLDFKLKQGRNKIILKYNHLPNKPLNHSIKFYFEDEIIELSPIETIKIHKKLDFINKGNSNFYKPSIITKSVDENGDKFWAFVKRRIGDLDSGGGGTLEYIDGTGKYKALIGKKCNYATRYIGNRNFHIQKCKFSKELIAKLKRN